MTNLVEIRRKYTVDEIKALFYSMTDTIYDILFNSDKSEQETEEYQNILSVLTKRSQFLTRESIMYIRYKMHMDLDAMNGNINHQADLYNLAYAFIYSYYPLAFSAIRRYTGTLTHGRLHPDRVATNGCKKAYLFVHDRHPKHRLNKSASDLIDLVVNDVYPKEKNLGEI